MNTIIILAIVCLFLSIAIYIFVGRRKFYRRNQSGIETFRTYSSSVLTPLGERILKLVSLLLFIAGLLLFVVWYFANP
jgi:ABC-type multidrug transport system permease subunit